MVDETYFFDSYAMIEIVRSNPNYMKYLAAKVTTAKNNLFEVYYNLLREGKKEAAEAHLDIHYDNAIDFEMVDLMEAAKLRLIHKKHGMSMVDCLGYAIALRLKIKFLTGDKEFKGMDNVEFVK